MLADASHLQSIVDMKTSTLPAVRVEPALRSAAEEVLDDGESLSVPLNGLLMEVRKVARTRRCQPAACGGKRQQWGTQLPMTPRLPTAEAGHRKFGSDG
jgi:hypothetical protein